MRVILARHGDAVRANDKFHGITDEPLTSEGRTQVYETARELAKYHPTIIYYCPTKRNAETAKILSDELGLPRKKSDELKPLDMGDLVGKPVSKFLEVARYFLENTDEKIPGGESIDEWAAKYLPFFEKYFKHKSNDTIIMVTHGRNILLSKAYIDSGKLAPAFEKKDLTSNRITTEHGGYAIAEPPDHFKIMTPKKVPAGRS